MYYYDFEDPGFDPDYLEPDMLEAIRGSLEARQMLQDEFLTVQVPSPPLPPCLLPIPPHLPCSTSRPYHHFRALFCVQSKYGSAKCTMRFVLKTAFRESRTDKYSARQSAVNNGIRGAFVNPPSPLPILHTPVAFAGSRTRYLHCRRTCVCSAMRC